MTMNSFDSLCTKKYSGDHYPYTTDANELTSILVIFPRSVQVFDHTHDYLYHHLKRYFVQKFYLSSISPLSSQNPVMWNQMIGPQVGHNK